MARRAMRAGADAINWRNHLPTGTPMLFNVAQLLRQEVGASRRYDLEPEEPVHAGRVGLIRVPEGVLVRCEAEVLLEAQCSRCLAAFAYRAHISFEEVYVQQVDLVHGHRLPEPDDPESFRIGMDNTIDIREAVRQYSETVADMRPLCRPDCPGLCPTCGTDLSIAHCQCERGPIDPRWAALIGLKRMTNG